MPAITLELSPHLRLVAGRHGWMIANPGDRCIGQALIQYGEYCEIESRFLVQLINNAGMVVEVGANTGVHTVELARAARRHGQSVLAFEPQRLVFQQLCANLAINGIDNVRAWPFACSSAAGLVYFDQPDYLAPGNFGAVAMKEERADGAVPVACVKLDDLVGSDPVGLIKIDAEGLELAVLQGAEETIARSRPVMYIENDWPDLSRELIEWLWSRHYRLWWHLPVVFNESNFFGKTENVYGEVVSINMLAIPVERAGTVNGLHEITDSSMHPTQRRPA